ncbi:MAG: SDR family NAD(P)-dependent oxidoreductase [Bacteroidales bacterium]|nr:SDR family NAD(P)-dependent oxidoreductase [Bacteroidales bacterium]
MNYYYVTGTGKGIGKALALHLLQNEENYVIGLSRTNVIKNERFEFIPINLKNFDEVKKFQFIDIQDADKIVLINNAGIIGHINHVGAIDNNSIYETFMVNSIAPAVLMNNFIKAYQKQKIEKIVLTVSSGAGRHAIESWAAYCASKSAIDMFSWVADEEQKLSKNDYPVKIFSVAPGIVDTQMQTQIRNTDKSDFSGVDKFIEYKNKNMLNSPEKTAELLGQILQNPENFDMVLLDVREI